MKPKIKVVLKWSLITISGFILLIVATGLWFFSLIPADTHSVSLEKTSPQDVAYLTTPIPLSRGKILAVVTSCNTLGKSGKKSGYELTELSRAYYVFQANGFDVDVASPRGGKPTPIIDPEDMTEIDYAFLNDSLAQYKVSHTIPMREVVPENYVAVYFVGGKGAMFDFPEDPHIQTLVRQYHDSGKVIGAVCHGPAALINVTLNDGTPLLQNKTVSCFTNREELFLIPDAPEIFPFLLQDKLVEKGARFSEGYLYLHHVSEDGNLVTGQNPWSTWGVAEAMVQRLGYSPKKRDRTAEENAVSVLAEYEASGLEHAKKTLHQMHATEPNHPDRKLMAMHVIVAGMEFDLKKSIALLRLLSHARSSEGG